ncbi:MAG: ATP-binding protein [Pseudomonadota bacterium]
MSRFQQWFQASGDAQQHLARLFLLLVGGVLLLITGYWLMVLEPQLHENARSNANVLAQSHVKAIADVLSENDRHPKPEHLNQVLDEILILTEQASGKHFVQRIELELDYDVLGMQSGLIPMQRGAAACVECFVTTLPLYDSRSRELLGLVRFYASDHFYRELSSSARLHLLLAASLVVIILSLTWHLIAGMMRKIRSNERTLQSLFEASPLPMVLTRPDSEQVLLVNQAAMDYFKVSKDDISNARTGDFYVDKSDQLHILEELQRHHQIDQYEFEVRTAPGNNRWVTCSGKIIDYKGLPAVILGLTDVSTFKQNQQALSLARDAAEAADQAKSEFLATMSHEIRTPMNGILGMVQLLQRTPQNEQQSGYLNAIATSGEVLLDLLNDILDLSKIEAGKLELSLTDYDLHHQLDGLLISLSERARRKGLELSMEIAPDVPSWLHGDSKRIRQVLINLIGNALKFTESGSVTVTVEKLQSAGDAVELQFAVQDTGIGIDVESQKHLFENFSQSDSSISRRYGGSGLGLAICKRLIHAMGGVIGLDSEPGQGSRFFFNIWLRTAEQVATYNIEEDSAPVRLEPLSVLVAEDVLINRHVVRSLLESEGHTVFEAVNGMEAVTSLQQNDIDVILMDLHMPEMDGITATREIRSLTDPMKAQVPVIALTANILQEETENCRSAGMDGFVMKPFTIEKLLNELSVVLQKRDPTHLN